MMAQGDDLGVSLELRQPPRQIPQRNQMRASDVRDLRLARFADIEQQKIRFARTFALQIARGDFDSVPRLPSPVPYTAERLVVDQLSHRRIRAAHRTVAIFLECELAKLRAPSVEQQQPADQRLSKTDDQFDRFKRLERSNNPRQDAEHSALGA